MTTRHRLRPHQIAKFVKDPGTYADGGSLFLVVRAPGKASWVYRFRDGSTIRNRGLGSVADVSLTQAREKRDTLQDAPTAAAGAALPFEVLATRYLDHHASDFGPAQLTRNRALIRLHAAPLSRRIVSAITVEQVADVLRPLWNSTVNSKGAKLRALLERIFNAAELDRNPASWARLQNHLSRKPVDKRSVASLPYQQLPEVMAELALDDGVAARALRFLVMTGLRLKEGCGVRWSEVDFVGKVLTIPAARMKIKKTGDFMVPLSKGAISLLRRLHNQRGADDFVFPGRLGSFIGRHAMHNAVGRMERVDGQGRPITIHGMRSTFATWAQEQKRGGVRLFDAETIDACLAHFPGGVRGAYQRSRDPETRRALMAAWGKHAGA